MTSLSAVGPLRGDVQTLPTITETSYENVFRVYSTENTSGTSYLYYNILNSVYLPSDLTPDTYYIRSVQRTLPWTSISYNEYQTIDLWWLICAANGIINPLKYPEPGTQLKIIKPNLVRPVLENIKQQLNL